MHLSKTREIWKRHTRGKLPRMDEALCSTEHVWWFCLSCCYNQHGSSWYPPCPACFCKTHRWMALRRTTSRTVQPLVIWVVISPGRCKGFPDLTQDSESLPLVSLSEDPYKSNASRKAEPHMALPCLSPHVASGWARTVCLLKSTFCLEWWGYRTVLNELCSWQKLFSNSKSALFFS